ncbi:protein SHQ1 homolog [Aricia agestis]|uniref:protein SHQ1 homolog n=1 Tax=Aricia agestis TaxID=91739 RepID=UPI001C206B32|nr:protein SHQ1 homolog [Aricia agestis]
MLTPRFKLTQDDNHVYITINAPYTNIRETEVDVDGENFLFVSSPYFLRLRLPGKIVESERSKGSYVCDSGDFTFVFDKETSGEHFENLDMITSLLAPRDIPDVNPDLIQMLEEDGVTVEDDNDDSDSVNSEKYTYGFGNKISNQFCEIGTEFPQIFELKTPENVPVEERHELRQKYENLKFSSDHYLADLYEKELIEPYLVCVAKWDGPDFNIEVDTAFDDEEVSVLKELPNKHYILTSTENKQVLLGLIDILFGYCYDKRTTMDESTIESSWTINKLSSTLSWFCVFNDYKEVLVACYRRALIYPIFRNFELCNKVKQDLLSLLRKGKKFVIKCLVSIYKMFNNSCDARYILNQLYIKDYLVYIQKIRAEEIDELCNNIANVEVTKADLDLELEEYESAADIVRTEEIMENEMAVKMASMSLLPDLRRNAYNLETDSDETDSSDSSSDSSDSSSDSSDSSSELDSDDDPL